MRKLFTLCLLVFALSVSAQWQQTGSKVRYVNGLGIPTRDTAAGVLADSSQILIRPADSSLYVKYKRTWLRVGGGGGSIAGSGTTNYIPKFTSSTAIGNSQIFDNGTSVGIGTTSPGSILEAAQSTPIFTLNASSSTGLHGIEWKNSGVLDAFIKQQPNTAEMRFSNGRNGSWGGFMTFYTDVSERMRITSGGNVGIGTTSPVGRLHLLGAGTEMRVESNTTTDGFIRYINTSGSMSFGMSGAPTNTMLLYDRTNNHNAYEYLGGASGRHVWYTANAERMRITSAGDVGIGTAGITYKLHVLGNDNGLYVQGATIAPFNQKIARFVYGGNNNHINIEPSGSGVACIQFRNSNETVGALQLNPNGGNILLGTTTDNGTDRLQVSGSALVTGAFQAATTSGNVSLRTTATTYPFNISLGANAGIGMYQDGTTATLIGTNQTVSATAPLQILGTTLTLNASGNNNAQIFTNSNERFRVNGTGNVIVDPTQLGTKLLVNTTTDAGTDRVQVAGSISAEGFKQRYLARTTAYTATTGDYLIDCTTGTFTVTLYAASGNAGRILIIKNSGTGSITVDGNGAETIDGAATQTLGTQWSRITIMCDGTNWKIISN